MNYVLGGGLSTEHKGQIFRKDVKVDCTNGRIR